MEFSKYLRVEISYEPEPVFHPSPGLIKSAILALRRSLRLTKLSESNSVDVLSNPHEQSKHWNYWHHEN